jgi:hypothetical protein
VLGGYLLINLQIVAPLLIQLLAEFTDMLMKNMDSRTMTSGILAIDNMMTETNQPMIILRRKLIRMRMRHMFMENVPFMMAKM